MSRTTFCLRTIHDTWAADGTHQTTTLSPLTFRHLSHRGNKASLRA